MAFRTVHALLGRDASKPFTGTVPMACREPVLDNRNAPPLWGHCHPRTHLVFCEQDGVSELVRGQRNRRSLPKHDWDRRLLFSRHHFLFDKAPQFAVAFPHLWVAYSRYCHAFNFPLLTYNSVQQQTRPNRARPRFPGLSRSYSKPLTIRTPTCSSFQTFLQASWTH